MEPLVPIIIVAALVVFLIVSSVRVVPQARRYNVERFGRYRTTLRNVIGSMDLERTLTSREEINTQLRSVLDEATGKWGIRVNRVEIKAIDPPATIKEAMEKQMRAERDKRAVVLHAEGERQSK